MLQTFPHGFLYIPALEITESLLILLKRNLYASVVNPSLTKLVRSSWLDTSVENLKKL